MNDIKRIMFVGAFVIFIFGSYLPVRKPQQFASYGKYRQAQQEKQQESQSAKDSKNSENDKSSNVAGESLEKKNNTAVKTEISEQSDKSMQNSQNNSEGVKDDSSDASRGKESKSANDKKDSSNEENKNSISSSEVELTTQIKDEDIVLGDINAPVTLIEYSSYTCPHCSEFHQHTFDAIKKEYIDTGKVRYALREFPSDYQALDAAILARCSGNDKFYEFADILYKRQDNWAFRKNYRSILKDMGKIGGVDPKTFDMCLENKELKSKILQNRKEANIKLNLGGTPVFFVDGKKLEGAVPFKVMKENIDKKLAFKKQNPKDIPNYSNSTGK